MDSPFDQYIHHGWSICAIAPGSKVPAAPKWNHQWNTLKPGQLQQGWNAGLIHTLSHTCTLDIDNYPATEAWFAMRGIDLQQFFNAPDSVVIDSGNPGHAKLLFTLPFQLPTKRITVDRKTIFELRCATASGNSMQDILPPSFHPSGRMYQWTGNGDWRKPPILPTVLVELWQELLAPDSQRSIPTGSPIATSLVELASALETINPDCDRKTWIECLMGMKRTEHQDAYEITRQWSMKSESKYPGDQQFEYQWDSLHNNLQRGINPGTVIHYAKQAGWKRPAPDVKEMFAAIPEAPFERVKMEVGQGVFIPSLKIDLWPDALAARAVEVAEQVGCDPVVPLLAGLCAISAAVDKRTAVQITPTWKVPPTLWAMTIGEPADKKTPGSRPMFDPLKRLELEDRDRYQAEMLVWQGKEAAFAAAHKAYREHMADPGNTGNEAIPQVPTLPPEPQPKRLVLNDATTQKVVSMAQFRPQGFLLWLDEMNNWFSRLGNRNHTDDRGCWIQGYETGHYTMDRVGAGSIIVDNYALSIYGNCQPTVFRRNATETASDGLLQRFLPVVLDPERNGMWQDGRPSFMSQSESYEQLVRRVHSLPSFCYALSPEANEVFRAFGQWALTLRADERLLQVSNSYNTALGKLEGNCGRLMLLFHIIANPHCPFIEPVTVERAVALMKQFFYPMLRYTFLNVAQERDEVADVLLDYLVQVASVRTTVTLGELRRVVTHVANGRDTRKLDEAILAVMDDMVDRNWAAPYANPQSKAPMFAINPALAERYKTKRRAIIEAKERVIQHIREDMLKQYPNGKEVDKHAIGWEELQSGRG